MCTNFLLSFFRALKLPAKLLTGWVRTKRKGGKSELEKKRLAYVRNFDPSRCKNRTWQVSLGKRKRTFKQKKTHLRTKAKEKASKN